MLSFFPREGLDKILDLNESASEGFPTYFLEFFSPPSFLLSFSHSGRRPDIDLNTVLKGRYGPKGPKQTTNQLKGEIPSFESRPSFEVTESGVADRISQSVYSFTSLFTCLFKVSSGCKKHQFFNGASNGWQNKLQAVWSSGVCGAPSDVPPLLLMQTYLEMHDPS